jgi:iron complex outermembrane recepter protein
LEQLFLQKNMSLNRLQNFIFSSKTAYVHFKDISPMKKKIAVFFASMSLLGCLMARGQATSKITGIVRDSISRPVENALVSLIKLRSNTLVKTVLTDSSGAFEFITPSMDTFLVTVLAAPYQKYTSEPVATYTDRSSISLPPIELQRAMEKQLAEVTVVSKLLFVEKKIDRTIINPDALISNAGTNALELLEKSPGIQVDMNGVISLKGKQGVVVYIDDKPTYLSAADLANYLRSVSTSSIGQIEIMTNPPAKYDAAGNAGVINIKLKRTKTEGFNGGINTSYGQGVYARNNNSINFNYRINKFNFFTNASYNINNSYQDLYIKRSYYKANGDLNSLFNQNSYIKRSPSGANLKLGLDYYINKQSTMGVMLSGFQNINKTTTTNQAELYDANSSLLNTVTAISPSKRRFRNGSINLNYSYKPGTKGREWLFNLDQIHYGSNINQSLVNSIFLPGNVFVSKTNLISDLPATIDIQTAKADYIYPVKNGERWEVGMKTSFISTTNTAHFFDEENNIRSINNDFSNSFNYRENINAAYLNYSLEKKQFSIQAGLRFENTSIKGNQFGNSVRKDSSFKRPYNSVFPTFYVLYKLDTIGKHQLGFSYGRRIDRPNYQDMNPFTYPLDRFTLYAGNPFLQPTFSNNFELSHTYKNNITTTLQVSYVKNVISETIEQSTTVFYSRPGNIGKQASYSLSVNGTFKPWKWWTLQLYTEVSRNVFTSTLYGQNLNNTGTFWYIGPTNQFQISKTWTAELNGSYQTSVYYGQFILIPVWQMSAGVAKKIMKQKASIKLNLSDVFYTNQPGGDIQSLSNSAASWLSYLDSRVISLSFSYRFNKGKGLAARTSGASDSEKNRVK